MFRKMRRFNQQITDEECIEVLKNSKRGVLSVIGDDGYPYGVPMDHWYNEEDGKIYFHGAMDGHKNDAIKSCDKVSYTVLDDGYVEEGDWAINFKSVITFGRMSFVKDEEKARKICTSLVKKFTDDEEFLEHELKFFFPRVQCFELTPEHMTGKRVKEK